MVSHLGQCNNHQHEILATPDTNHGPGKYGGIPQNQNLLDIPDGIYIRLERDFAYLLSIIDWYSRRVPSRRISNTTEAVFFVNCLERVFRRNGKPEMFSDQNSQFTSQAITGVLQRSGIKISMHSRGQVRQHICGALVAQRQARGRLIQGLQGDRRVAARVDAILCFYNNERMHQSLRNKTPDAVCESVIGGRR